MVSNDLQDTSFSKTHVKARIKARVDKRYIVEILFLSYFSVSRGVARRDDIIFREVYMKSNTASFAASVALSLLLIGCQKATDTPKPVASNADPVPASESVAASPSALPTPDSAIKPTGPTPSTSGDANAPSQAASSELNKAQESAAMPLPGQVNNHSTPAPLSDKK
jgi:hypothetical protein